MADTWGEPEDVEGECNARIYIGDNFGDNHTTMRCQLSPGHEGLHKEMFHRGPGKKCPVTVTWEHDEREDRARLFEDSSDNTPLSEQGEEK